MSLGIAVSGLLVEAATTTAIDVVTRRSINPKIRMAGQIWRAYSLLNKTVGAYESVRIAAYSDAAGIIAGELTIQKISSSVRESLPHADGLNFKLIDEAEGLVLCPDFESRHEHDPAPLDPLQSYRTEFAMDNFNSHGAKLYDLVHNCVEGAARAQKTTLKLLQNEECGEPRQSPMLGWNETWLDRINTGLGFALWVPVPTIGVGSGIYGSGKYRGTFRRSEPEGYGIIEYHDGKTYIGQVRQAWPFGYGVTKYPDGRVFAGHNSLMHRDLGVVFSAKGDKAIFGASYSGRSQGFGRQIGLSEGVGSVSGFWDQGELSLESSTLGSIHRKNREKYRSSFFKTEEWSDFQRKLEREAREHGSKEDLVDGHLFDVASLISRRF